MPGIDVNALLVVHCDGSSGSTTFTDSSQYAKTVNANGNVQVDTAQSKFGNSSAIFDGSNDFLSIADNPDFQLGGGNGDFTIDCWFRFNTVKSSSLFGQGSDTNNIWYFLFFGNKLFFEAYSSGITIVSTAQTWVPSPGIWYHIAVVRTGNIFKIFVDGSQIGTDITSSGTIPDLSAVLRMGNLEAAAGYDIDGWMDEIRISNIARWTTTFTPPTEAYSTSTPITSASDTRTSMIGLDMPWLHVYPFPDGTISVADRQHIAYKYRNIAAQQPSVSTDVYRTLLGAGA